MLSMALRAAGFVIPDDSVIEYSHLENKREIAEKVRQMTGTAEPTQEQVQMEQAMRDIQFKQIEMQLAQMKAQIQNMESDTALKMAKAKTELLTDDTAEMEEFKVHANQIMNVQDNMTKLEIAKLKAEQEYQSKQTENQTRIETATIRNAGAREQNASKVAVELTKLDQQRKQLAGAKNE